MTSLKLWSSLLCPEKHIKRKLLDMQNLDTHLCLTGAVVAVAWLVCLGFLLFASEQTGGSIICSLNWNLIWKGIDFTEIILVSMTKLLLDTLLNIGSPWKWHAIQSSLPAVRCFHKSSVPFVTLLRSLELLKNVLVYFIISSCVDCPTYCVFLKRTNNIAF